MKETRFDAILWVVSLSAGAFMVGVGTGNILSDNSWRDQVSAHGCAKYYLDSNNQRQWNWKECGK